MAASIWIKTAATLPRHPKLLALCDFLDISRAEALGRLVLLWIYALEFRPSGIFENAEEVALAMEWPRSDAVRLVSALRLCGGFGAGFVDPPRPEDNGRIFLHDWMDYSGIMDNMQNIKRRSRRESKEEKKIEEKKPAPENSERIFNSGSPIVPLDKNHEAWLKKLGLL